MVHHRQDPRKNSVRTKRWLEAVPCWLPPSYRHTVSQTLGKRFQLAEGQWMRKRSFSSAWQARESSSPESKRFLIIKKIKKEERKITMSSEEEVYEVHKKINFKVSTSEAWFPELEKVLNSGKEESFFSQRTREPLGPHCCTGNTARLGWRLL